MMANYSISNIANTLSHALQVIELSTTPSVFGQSYCGHGCKVGPTMVIVEGEELFYLLSLRSFSYPTTAQYASDP